MGNSIPSYGSISRSFWRLGKWLKTATNIIQGKSIEDFKHLEKDLKFDLSISEKQFKSVSYD